MLTVILEVEKFLSKTSSDDAYIRDSFDTVISKVSEIKVTLYVVNYIVKN